MLAVGILALDNSIVVSRATAFDTETIVQIFIADKRKTFHPADAALYDAYSEYESLLGGGKHKTES